MARKRRVWTNKKKAAAGKGASTVPQEEGIGKEVVVAPHHHQAEEEMNVFDLTRVKTEAFPDHLDDDQVERGQDGGGGARISNIDRLEKYLNESRRQSVSQPTRKSSRIQVLKEKRELARAELATALPRSDEQKQSRQRKGRPKKQLPLPPIEFGGLPQQWCGGGGVKLEMLPVVDGDDDVAQPVPEIVPSRKIKLEVVSPPRTTVPGGRVTVEPDSLGKELVVYNKDQQQGNRRRSDNAVFRPFSSVAADKVYVVDREKDKAMFNKPSATILKAAVANFHALMTETVPALTKTLNREQAHNQALKATLVVAQDLEAQLVNENNDLRQRIEGFKAISDRERYRAEKAWQAIDGTKLYHKMKDEGEMQRHFLNQQYAAAMDVIRTGCDERLKAIEADRAKLCRENEVLHRKVEAGVKKQGKRVRALQGIVRVLVAVIIGPEEHDARKLKERVGGVLKELGRERAFKEWEACFGKNENVDWIGEAVDAVLKSGVVGGRVGGEGKKLDRMEEEEDEEEDTLNETAIQKQHHDGFEDFVYVEEADDPVVSDKEEEEARLPVQDYRFDESENEEEDEEQFVEVEEPSPAFEAVLDMPMLPVFASQEIQGPAVVDVVAADDHAGSDDDVPEEVEVVDDVGKGVVNEALWTQEDEETQKIVEETVQREERESVVARVECVVDDEKYVDEQEEQQEIEKVVEEQQEIEKVVDEEPEAEKVVEEQQEIEKVVEEEEEQPPTTIPLDPRGAELLGKFVSSWDDDEEEDDRPPIVLLKTKSYVARERARGRRLRRRDDRGSRNMEQQHREEKISFPATTWGETPQQRWNPWRSDGDRREPYHHGRNEEFVRFAPPRDSNVGHSFPAHQQLVGVIQPEFGRGNAFGHPSSARTVNAFDERQPTPVKIKAEKVEAVKSLKLEEAIKKAKLEKESIHKEPHKPLSLSLRSRLTASMAEITAVGKGENVCEKMKLEKHIAERMQIKKMEKLAAGAKQPGVAPPAPKTDDYAPAVEKNAQMNLSDDDDEELLTQTVPCTPVQLPAARLVQPLNTTQEKLAETGHSPISDDVESPRRPSTPTETRGASPISDESWPPPTPKSRERTSTRKRKIVKYTMDELFGDEEEKLVAVKEVCEKVPPTSVLHDDLQVSDDDEEEEEEVANNDYPPPPASPDPGDEADDEMMMMSGRQDFMLPHAGRALPIIFDLDPRLHGMFSSLLSSSLGSLLETDSIRMTFGSRNWTLQKLVECAYVQMAQTRDDELRASCERAELVTVCPLVPAFAKLLCVLNTVAREFPREYGGLPTALLRFICDKVVQDDTRREMDNDELLVNVGRLIGAVTHATGDADLALAILLNFSLCRPPRVYAVAYGILCSNTAVIGYIDMSQFETLCLTRRAILVSLVRNPRFGRNRFLRGVSDLFSRTLQIVVPEVVFPQFVDSVIQEVCSLESDRELKKGAKVIAMLVVQLGLQYFDGVFTALASDWVQAWRDKRVSDGAVSAMFSSIGIVCQSLRREDVPETLEKQKKVVNAVRSIQSMPMLVRDTLNLVVDQIDRSVLRSPGDPIEFWNTPEPTRKRTASPKKKKKNKNKKRRVMMKASDDSSSRRAAAVVPGPDPDNPFRGSGDKPGTWVRGSDAAARGGGGPRGGRGRGGRGGGVPPQWRRGRSSAQWNNE